MMGSIVVAFLGWVTFATLLVVTFVFYPIFSFLIFGVVHFSPDNEGLGNWLLYIVLTIPVFIFFYKYFYKTYILPGK